MFYAYSYLEYTFNTHKPLLFSDAIMKYKCDLCDVPISNEYFWQQHLAGKKHQQLTEQRAKLEAMARRSIYLNNFKHPINADELTREMSQFGEVERILTDKSEKNGFAIVEFKEEDAAQNLLHSIHRLKIGKSMVRIQPRRVDFGPTADQTQLLHLSEHHNQITGEKILESIEGATKGLSAQIEALVKQFGIPVESMNERAQFAQQLQHFIQRYFVCPIHIRVFGSSATGLGFVNSDLDLNMVFEEDLKETDSGSSIGSPSNSNGCQDTDSMDHDILPEDLESLTKPMERITFMQLTRNNRVRLLNKLMNAFRKETGFITAHVPVPDARTPIVRLMLRHPKGLPCELSVQNLLSECKANLVRDLVRAETTGKLWQLLFLLKLWASGNGLFSPNHLQQRKKPAKKNEEGEGSSQQQEMEQDDEEQQHPNKKHPAQYQHPKAHWNSYSLSLCTIAFLQNQRCIPPIGQLIRPNSRTIRGWKIEYDLPFFQLNEEIPSLLKGLFTFLYQQLKEDRILVPLEGQVHEAKEFKQKHVDTGEDDRIKKLWRFSLVNVQDPLELSHNVTANVSRESLALLRWKVMYAISALKRSPDDLHNLFQLENVKKLQEERRLEKEQNIAKRAQQQGGKRRKERRKQQQNHEEMEVDEEAD